ncbi:MAG: nitronate monooxygenase family protein [Rhodospirillales bacterium]
MWPDRRIMDLFGIELPILQAPMAGAQGLEMAIAVSEAGGLGALPCAMLSLEQARAELGIVRQRTQRPFNVNFFCHQPPVADPARDAAWKKRLASYYSELGLDLAAVPGGALRQPFDDAFCQVIEEFKPAVASFHFGLPNRRLRDRVKATGAKMIASATSVEEARWLEGEGCDAIIAQGYEAGGHRGVFMSKHLAAQPGTMALVPQMVDAVKVPVIAAGGIGDARGMVAALALGASAVQIGTAYLLTPESKISQLHRDALKQAHDDSTVLTNVFTGRPARGIVNRVVAELGPISSDSPEFPLAANAIGPLRAKAEAAGSTDFTPLWSGQAPTLAREMPAGELTTKLAVEAIDLLSRLSSKA